VLYPVEFEQRADVYVMNRSLADGYRLVLDDSLHADETPRAAGWIDAARAWVVIGQTMGTVLAGRRPLRVRARDGRLAPALGLARSGRTQAVSFAPPSTVQLRTFDANMMPRGDSSVVLPAAAPGGRSDRALELGALSSRAPAGATMLSRPLSTPTSSRASPRSSQKTGGPLAQLLAHIAEIDARHLYLREGFESMQGYCMAALHLTEHAAMKRIQIARLCRQFPALLAAIADGRLHLGSARVIATHLTESNVVDLIEKAANRTVVQVEILMARLFPEAEPLRLDDGISQCKNRLATWHVDFQKSAPSVRTKIAPVAPERFTLQVTISGTTHDKLRRAQELLGHALPSGNVERVLRGVPSTP
jgi:hypothetical protein